MAQMKCCSARALLKPSYFVTTVASASIVQRNGIEVPEKAQPLLETQYYLLRELGLEVGLVIRCIPSR